MCLNARSRRYRIEGCQDIEIQFGEVCIALYIYFYTDSCPEHSKCSPVVEIIYSMANYLIYFTGDIAF